MIDKNQVFNTIRDNLTRSYIFYIPERYYPDIEKTFIKDIIKPDMLNIIAYSNLERKITTTTLESHGLDILNKGDLLNDNIDQLIKQKENLSETAFNHLLEQYKEYVDAHWLIISWMSKNLIIDLPNTPLSIINLFETQTSIFDKHQTKIRSYFGKQELEKEADLKNILKVSKETLDETPIIKFEKEVKTIKEKPIIQELKKPTEKVIKKPLMTDEKARNFLLKTVFNIDPKYLVE